MKATGKTYQFVDPANSKLIRDEMNNGIEIKLDNVIENDLDEHSEKTAYSSKASLDLVGIVEDKLGILNLEKDQIINIIDTIDTSVSPSGAAESFNIQIYVGDINDVDPVKGALCINKETPEDDHWCDWVYTKDGWTKIGTNDNVDIDQLISENDDVGDMMFKPLSDEDISDIINEIL